jgi:hypothetical protein
MAGRAYRARWQKAVVAVANKNARILWAVLAKGLRFDVDYVSKPGGGETRMGPCPGTKITGGKVMSGTTRPTANRVAQALRLDAAALRTSQSALGAYYRRLCARIDKAKAVTAATHKLARLIYSLLSKSQEYTDQVQAYYEERYRQRVLHNLQRKAQRLGMSLVPATPESAAAWTTPPASITWEAFLERPFRYRSRRSFLCKPQ